MISRRAHTLKGRGTHRINKSNAKLAVNVLGSSLKAYYSRHIYISLPILSLVKK